MKKMVWNRVAVVFVILFLAIIILSVFYRPVNVRYAPIALGSGSGIVQLYHPADLNLDSAVSLNEFTNYSSHFKLGKSWPTLPSPPNANYYSRAYLLLKRGLATQGAYNYNASSSCPACFVSR